MIDAREMGRAVAQRRRRLRRTVGASSVAIAFACAAPAWASCSPPPTGADASTTCTGTTSQGLRITGDYATAYVASGATVLSGTEDAAVVAAGKGNFVDVEGTLNGGTKPGFLGTGGVYVANPPSNFPHGAWLNVRAGGVVEGSNAVVIGRLSNNPAAVVLDLSNYGTLTGTTGSAISATDAGTTLRYFRNEASGTINGDIVSSVYQFTNQGTINGGIVGAIYQFDNRGAIDGGAGGAITETGSTTTIPFYYSSAYQARNLGTIRSNSSAATIAFDNAVDYLGNSLPLAVENRGLITNSGTGAAITTSAAATVALSNIAGGQIASAGTTAIHSDGALTLYNSGTIIGSVVIGGGAGTVSRVDNRGGVITGNVQFGAGDDTFLGQMVNGSIATGVSGTVDGGAGLDTLVADVSGDGMLTSLALPTNFERLGLNLVNLAQVNLAADPGYSAGLSVQGSGTFTVSADVTTIGPAFSHDSSAYGALTFINDRTITANLASGERAIDLDAVSIVNNGSIVANGGDGIHFFTTFRDRYSSITPTLTNNGLIEASGTAVSTEITAVSTGFGISELSGSIANSGTIRSTGGTAVVLLPAASSTNSGIIEGATFGVDLSGSSLTNSGTISGGTAAVIMNVSPVPTQGGFYRAYDTLTNQAGGMISGGIVGGADPTDRVIQNAGTINGAIDFDRAGTGVGTTTLVNISGTINGDVRLGAGDDTFVTTFPSSPGNYAGVSGTVDGGAGTDTIIYGVDGTRTTTLVPPTGFERVEFELIDHAALTITSPTSLTATLYAGGDGTLDLTVSGASSANPILDLNGVTAYYYGIPPGGLSTISRGTLTYTADQDTAVRASFGTFENAGTINVSDGSGSGNPFAISNVVGGGSGLTAINSGSINLDGGTGITAAVIINTGSINQAVGARAADGVIISSSYQNEALTNSGSIIVDGNAVFGRGIVTNSGTIESRSDIAVTLNGGSLTNAATGTIRGATAAIQASNVTIDNQGAIIGEIMIGQPLFGAVGSTYIADGGTVDGNIHFGAGNDVFLQRAGTAGVTGMIDGGSGFDVYGRSYSSSTTAAIGSTLLTSFEGEIVEANGAGTVVTLANSSGGSSRDIYLVGTGAIINQVNIAANVVGGPPTSGQQVRGLASLTNDATISGAVMGNIGDLVNNGVIGANSGAAAVSLETTGSLAFANHGTVYGANVGHAGLNLLSLGGPSLSFSNDGLIEGGAYAVLVPASDDQAVSFSMVNSGTITSGEGRSPSLIGTIYYDPGHTQPANVRYTVSNSGTVRATGQSGIGVQLANFGTLNNSGLIETTGDGYPFVPVQGYQGQYAESVGVSVQAGGATVNNQASGIIRATGSTSVAVESLSGALNLINAGTITGGTGTVIPASFSGYAYPYNYLAGAIQSGYQSDHVVNTGTITGSVDLGDGDDTIENRGQITGDVYLRGGDDHFIQLATATFTGTADGGDGSDTLTFESNTGDVIDPARLGRYRHFENYQQIGDGVVSYSGTIIFDEVEITSGGLRGLAGSTLIAPEIRVGAGGTIGSAGTVDGNIAIGGTLSPGASPGTMTVNGDVALLAGSNSLFELTPTVSDKLLVSGGLTIASGAKITLTGEYALAPGASLELIAADGGIDGNFSTVVRPAGLLGFVARRGNTIQLFGGFLADPTFSRQAQASVAYTNDFLASGAASDAFVAALPSLLSETGESSESAFTMLTPQLYASARQIIVENGLSIVGAARARSLTSGDSQPRLFTFADALGFRRDLSGGRGGSFNADTNGHGLLGGLGWDGGAWALSGFVGYLDSSQHINALGAHTDAGGIVGGLQARYSIGGFNLGAMIAYDGGHGDARRPAPGGTAYSHFGMRGLTGDINAGGDLLQTGNWTLRGKAGVTYIWARRGEVSESGNDAFGLIVVADHSNAGFADSELRLVGGAATRFRPYVAVGGRYQFEGRASTALGGLEGGPLTLGADGAEHARFVVTTAAGISFDAAPNLSLSAGYDGEWGAKDRRDGVCVGLQARF